MEKRASFTASVQSQFAIQNKNGVRVTSHGLHLTKTFSVFSRRVSTLEAYCEKTVRDIKKIIANSFVSGQNWSIHQIKIFHWGGSLTAFAINFQK